MDTLPAVQGQLITPPNGTKLAPGLCSPGLKRLLTEGDGDGGACRLIHLNAKLRAECQEILPALQGAKTPAAEEEILEILVRNAPTYGITAPGVGGWMVFFGAYLDALEGLPAFAIEDAFLRWNRGEGHANLQMASFYPKPGQLFTLAQKGKAELWIAAGRAAKALAYAEAKTKPPPEVRKEVAGNLSDLLGELTRARKAPDPFKPRVTPQQMAEQIRQAPAKPAAQDDVGDVV